MPLCRICHTIRDDGMSPCRNCQRLYHEDLAQKLLPPGLEWCTEVDFTFDDWVYMRDAERLYAQETRTAAITPDYKPQFTKQMLLDSIHGRIQKIQASRNNIKQATSGKNVTVQPADEFRANYCYNDL